MIYTNINQIVCSTILLPKGLWLHVSGVGNAIK